MDSMSSGQRIGALIGRWLQNPMSSSIDDDWAGEWVIGLLDDIISMESGGLELADPQSQIFTGGEAVSNEFHPSIGLPILISIIELSWCNQLVTALRQPANPNELRQPISDWNVESLSSNTSWWPAGCGTQRRPISSSDSITCSIQLI